MVRFCHAVWIGGCLLAALGTARAQSPGAFPVDPAQPVGRLGAPLTQPDAATADSREQQLQVLLQRVNNLQAEQQAAQNAPATEQQKKQIELLQKQVETQQKLIELLAEQIKKRPPATAPADKLQAQTATLESRSQRAAQRDQELAGAVDDLREHADAEERNGPRLPAQLKELFLPSGNNETPLSIYGALAFGYSKMENSPTIKGFYFGEFTPDFFLKLNDWFFLEAEIGVGPTGSVSAGSFAQADFIVNDWLTIIAGRFVAPIGWFNERLNTPWVNKLPADAPGSAPPLWMQVLPPMSLLGVQAQGSFYLGCSPIKMEYTAYVSNGLNVSPATAGAPTVDELANLENMQNSFNIISNDKAVGGRLGLWWPEMGLEGGLSGLYNGDYVNGGFEDSISLMAVDLNYHKGNWDVRLEYGLTRQQAGAFAGTPGLLGDTITRQGFYGQVAYRPRDLPNGILEKTELVYRYSYVDIRGLDPTMLTLSSYATPVDVPVRRQQNEFGINYWFYSRMVLKCAYQINDEPGFHLHDNQFIAEFDWGW
ncbi:MAG TPA: hypothetical protein VGY58_03920 [Gemmataceae bacterium]|nr:hypothetical protein [Gemmataceae bacterium]